MKYEEKDGNYKLSIYAEGRDSTSDYQFTKKRIIDNQMILISGYTGSGKSALLSNIIHEYKSHGYTIIIATEKLHNEFENGFLTFPVVEDFHLELLQKQRREPIEMEKLRGMLKIYHPFTFKIPPDKLMPPVNFYTYSLQELHEKSWGIFLSTDSDAMTARMAHLEASRLGVSENYLDFLSKIEKKLKMSKEDVEYSTRAEDLFVGGKTSSTVKTLEKIRDSFLRMRKHYFLQPKNHELNLNWKHIVNDNKHIHIFSTKWVNDERFRYFSIFQTLINLQKAIADHGKRPVLLILEEIKILLPRSAGSVYETTLAELMRKLLSSLRNEGAGVTVVGTTQNYNETNKDYRSSCSTRFIGKSSPEDIKAFGDYGISATDITTIKELKTGEFIWWEKLEDYSGVKGYSLLPPWAIIGDRDNFIDMYKKNYPDDMIKFKDVVKKMSTQMKEEDIVRRQQVKDDVKARKDKKKGKKEKDDLDSDIDSLNESRFTGDTENDTFSVAEDTENDELNNDDNEPKESFVVESGNDEVESGISFCEHKKLEIEENHKPEKDLEQPIPYKKNLEQPIPYKKDLEQPIPYKKDLEQPIPHKKNPNYIKNVIIPKKEKKMSTVGLDIGCESYNMLKDGGMTFSAIAKKLSLKTWFDARNEAMEYAKKIGDENFIKKHKW